MLRKIVNDCFEWKSGQLATANIGSQSDTVSYLRIFVHDVDSGLVAVNGGSTSFDIFYFLTF